MASTNITFTNAEIQKMAQSNIRLNTVNYLSVRDTVKYLDYRAQANWPGNLSARGTKLFSARKKKD